jgi:hypothetical protein
VQVNTKRDAKYSLKASYLEIYNEGVYDLVNFSSKAKSLPVKWDASFGFYVQGLKVHKEAARHACSCLMPSHHATAAAFQLTRQRRHAGVATRQFAGCCACLRT